MSETDRFSTGSVLQYATEAISQLSGREKRGHQTLAPPLNERYGTNVSGETAEVIKGLKRANDEVALVRTIKRHGLYQIDDYSEYVTEEQVEDSAFEDEANLSVIANLLDTKLTDAVVSRDDIEDATSKTSRESVYAPSLDEDVGSGTVYMTKTVSKGSIDKMRMAFDLDDENVVVVVDEYERWENLLGWEKLKQFPHGKNQIRQQYGGQLSDELLERLTAREDGDDETKDESSDTGRRTRTKPSEEVLNIAVSRKHSERVKRTAEAVADTFEDGDTISIDWTAEIDTLILFPTTSDKLMSDHWWIPGWRGYEDGEKRHAAIANCNKGTFEYLNRLDNVVHIEDYLDDAWEYDFETLDGPLNLTQAHWPNLVLHIMDDNVDAKARYFTQEWAKKRMPEVLRESLSSSKRELLPRVEEMVYAQVTKDDLFWMAPALKDSEYQLKDDLCIIGGTGSVCKRASVDLSCRVNIENYQRLRFPDWDINCDELKAIRRPVRHSLSKEKVDSLHQTLGRLHDAGQQPASESPQSRWSR